MDEDPLPYPAPIDDPFDRLLRRLGHFRSLPAGWPRLPAALGPPLPVVDRSAELRDPPADIIRTPQRIYVTFELSGPSRETVDIEATETHLTVRARGHNGREYHREVPLPERVDPRAIQATYRNDVLDISIPRKAHRVPIREADPDGR